MDHIARHAKAEQDPFAALANLLAHEIAINSFSFMDMLQSGSCDSEECQQLLWKSKIIFPNSGKDKAGRTGQIGSLLQSVVKEVLGWDKAKDKQTGLFRKTAAGNALAAGAGPDEVNRQLGWKRDSQSRSHALHHSGSHVDVQAVLAGFDKDSWRQNHHLARAAAVVGESWCDALLPRLSASSELTERRQEILHTMQKLAEAYWQALPMKVLKYGMNFVAATKCYGSNAVT